MPNLDGGHYFLTVLAPVRTDVIVFHKPGWSASHRHRLQQKLALMYTGPQTAASPPEAIPSAFSRNTLNHLARFVLIDGPAYNGRLSGDTLVGVVKGIDPLVPQPVDQLTNPYLLFAADIDAPGDGETALRAYTDALWATMRKDLDEIFGSCLGYEGVVTTADDFHAYIKRCQVETTMPFNDYWAHDELMGPKDAKPGTKAEDAKPQPGTRTIKIAAYVVLGAILVWLGALVWNGLFALFDVHGRLARAVEDIVAWGAIVVPALLGLVVLALYLAYRCILKAGLKPFPTAPGSDLPSVLKSLFVQRHFTRFAIETQGLDDAALHARFGAFLAEVKPVEAEPTQAPGTIATPLPETVP